MSGPYISIRLTALMFLWRCLTLSLLQSCFCFWSVGGARGGSVAGAGVDPAGPGFSGSNGPLGWLLSDKGPFHSSQEYVDFTERYQQGFTTKYKIYREFGRWKVNSLALERQENNGFSLPLDPDFLQTIRQLGRRPSLNAIIDNIIRKYGTHFLLSATLGGEESLMIFVDKRKLSRTTEGNESNGTSVTLEALHQLAASYFIDRESTLHKLHHIQIASTAIKVTETRTGPLGCSNYDNLDSVSSVLVQSPENKIHLQGLQAILPEYLRARFVQAALSYIGCNEEGQFVCRENDCWCQCAVNYPHCNCPEVDLRAMEASLLQIRDSWNIANQDFEESGASGQKPNHFEAVLTELPENVKAPTNISTHKHQATDEKMLENPSSTHTHQATDEKMLEDPSRTHTHQATDEKMLEVSSSTHTHQATDEKMLENPSSTHTHQATDEKMLVDPSSTHTHQATDEKMLEDPSSTHTHQATDEKMLEVSSSTHKHQATDEKMLEDPSSTHTHQATDEKMLEDPSSTHTHQATDEKMLEDSSSTHKHQATDDTHTHQATDEKMLEDPSSTHTHQATDEKMLEDPSSTHTHEATDEKMLEDSSSTHKHQATDDTHTHQATDEKMLEDPSSTHTHQATDEKMLVDPSSTHTHQATDEKMLEDSSSTHTHQATDEKMLEDPSSTHTHQATDEKMLEDSSSTHTHQATDEKMLENPSSTHTHQATDEKMLEDSSSNHKHQATDEKMLEDPSSTHKHQATDEKMLEDPSSTHTHQAKSTWGLSWKRMLGATAVVIGGIALAVAIYTRK
uniref:BMP/retinoic acid-inducible neural-specific protein 3-like n=1 Tax=Gouania willdenowi TaxID=441366 RepID=A0A8C5E0F6_GOUWI